MGQGSEVERKAEMRNFAMRHGHTTGGLSAVNSKKGKDGRAIQKVWQPHLTDEQAKDVIRSFLAGTPQSVLVARTGFSESCIRNLCNGVNRGHLLMQVEKEAIREKGMMG